MRNLAYQIKQIYGHTKSGSYSSQASRRRKCSIIARDIEACGYRNLDIQNLKPKHIEALVALWKGRELAIGTIKNLMTELRRIAEYIGKENIVKRTNREYGIDDRVYVTNVSKANKVTDKQLSCVTDPYTKASLRLQREFGLRREESIKIHPEWADLGDRLRLKDAWTKGGKYREVPIVPAEQRHALDNAKALAGTGSLIPQEMRLSGSRANVRRPGSRMFTGNVTAMPSCGTKNLPAGNARPAAARPPRGSHPRRRRAIAQ